MTSFKCAGDLGDIVYTLPVVRFFGGGVYMIEAAHYTRQCLTRSNWCGIDILLKKQPYIVDVIEWQGHGTSVCLNDFRAHMVRALRRGEGRQTALVDWMLSAHAAPLTEKDKAWLTVEPEVVAPVVISRAGANRANHHVYHNPAFPWHRVWKKYRDEAVFIGTKDEHEMFCAVNGELPHHPTKDLYEVARVIAGCSLFIGNQSCPHAIAEGLKKNIVLEVWPSGSNTLHFRPGVVHGWDQKVELPDV